MDKGLINIMEEELNLLRKKTRLRKRLKKKVGKTSATLSGQVSRMRKLKNYQGKISKGRVKVEFE